eukprot:4898569-Amphidinium_carterae.1
MAATMDRQSPQMLAAFHLLQKPWVMILPVVPEESTGAEVALVDGDSYCQVIIVAIKWAGTRFGAAPTHAVIAVPAEAGTEEAELLNVATYPPDEEQADGECAAALFVVPGT